MAQLRLFIDDSGNKEYGPATSRYFVYAGVIADVAQVARLAGLFKALKREAFGDESVELKSNWTRQPRERRKRYLEPYGLSNGEMDVFVDKWYSLMESEDLVYLAAVIDKPAMQAKYKTPYNPSATAYQFLLQRYQMHLRRRNAQGYVTIDDMSGSTPKKNQWKDLLKLQHRRLKKDGCPLTKLAFDRVAESPQFADSARFDLLQVADFAAYNVFRQFRDYGDQWDRNDLERVPIYPWFGRILPRFALGPEGRLEGWGVVKWPSARRSKWAYVRRSGRADPEM